MSASTQLPVVTDYHVFGAHFDDAAVQHRLFRIEEDIVKNLADLVGIDLDGPQIVRNIHSNADRGARACEVDGIIDELGNGNHAPDGRATLGEGQQLG